MPDISTLRCLRLAAETLASHNGPVDPGTFNKALNLISSAVVCCNKPASHAMIDAIENLLVAVRDNETA